MNAKIYCFTLCSKRGYGLKFDLLLNDESIPYNPNHVFHSVLIRTLKICAPRLTKNPRIELYDGIAQLISDFQLAGLFL